MNGGYCVTCRVQLQRKEGALFAALRAAGCGVRLRCSSVLSTWTGAFSIGRYRCWYRGNYYRYRYETNTGSIGRYPIPDTGIGLSLVKPTKLYCTEVDQRACTTLFYVPKSLCTDLVLLGTATA